MTPRPAGRFPGEERALEALVEQSARIGERGDLLEPLVLEHLYQVDPEGCNERTISTFTCEIACDYSIGR